MSQAESQGGAKVKTSNEVTALTDLITSVVRLSPDIIYVYDLVSRSNVYSNDGIETVLGYSVSEVKAMGENLLSSLMHPDDFPTYFEHVVSRYAQARDGEPIRHQYRMRHRDGTWRWLESHEIIYKRLPDGSPHQIVGVVRDVTEQRQTLAALERSEQLLHQSQKVGRIGHFVLDMGAGKWTGSRVLDELFGISPDYDRSISAWLGIVHPDHRQAIDDHVAGVMRGEHRSIDREFMIRKVDTGEVRWIHGRGTVELGPNGSPSRVFGTAQDITERKRGEMRLQESEHKFRHITSHLNVGVFMSTLTGKFIYANASVARIGGYDSVEEILGIPAQQLYPVPEEREGFIRVLQTHGSVQNYRAHSRRKDGSVCLVALNATIQHDEVGAPEYILGTVEDVTERTRALDALAASERRLAVTLRSIADGVIATDQAGRIQIINAAAEVMTGYKLQDAVGRPLHEIYRTCSQDTGEPCPNPVEQILVRHGADLLPDPATLVARDGSVRAVSSSGAPILAGNGDVLGLVLVFRDVGERQRLLDAVNRQQKLEALGILAGGIAHDFNNLLGGILGNVDLAAQQTQEPQVREYLDTALSSMNRARSLTRQLLTFAKGGAPLKKVEALLPLVRDTVNFALSGTSVSARFEVAPDLSRAEFDRNQLGQVIDNLVINAVQAMPSGGQLLVAARNVAVGEKEALALEPGRYVELSFTDTGVGIPHDLQTRIFDPFFTTKQKGSGLGLATSYSIVRRHAGAILVRSEPGKGSTFTVLLPAADGVPDVEESAENDLPLGTGDVLVMDDEESMRVTAGAMLGKLGYGWIGAGDGQEAIDLVARFAGQGRTLAFAILDLTVPGGKGGLEAAQEILAICPALPLFVASGYAEDPIIAAPGKYGFLDSIRKPFTTAELGDMIARHRQRLGAASRR